MSEIQITTKVVDQPLAPDYYLKNFHFLVEWVWARYDDLLSPHEQHFIIRFRALSAQAQCLLVRLISRKGPWFRLDKLHYAEIVSVPLAIDELAEQQLIKKTPLLTLDELSSLVTKPELLQLFPVDLQGQKNARKDQLIAQLRDIYCATENPSKPWALWTGQPQSDVIFVDHQATLASLLLLFFGNSHQDLTEFVLQDLGLFRYENYTIDHQHRLFNTREELDHYKQLTDWRDQLEHNNDCALLLQISEQLPQFEQSSTTKNNDRIKRRYAKLCNHIAYALEQQGHFDYAEKLYRLSHLAPARERRVRLLEKQNYYAEAWDLLQQLLHNPVNEHELQIAQRIAPRLAKKLAITYTKPPTPIKFVEHQLQLTRLVDNQQQPLPVEEITRLHLHSADAPCIYAENTLFNGLFGLWLWPEMFRALPGAFANPFQSAPLDLYQEDFAQQRDNLTALWNALDDDTYRLKIVQTWQKKQGIVNPFIDWNFLTLDLLQLALAIISAQDLQAIFKRILFDIKANCSGFPDLIQFFPTQNRYQLIEVKGPGDRIQDNQARWLDYFATHQIPAEVYYVGWQ